MSTLIDSRILRAPDELAVTPFGPRRVLIVGSCLAEDWAHRMRKLREPCESDVYLLGRELPEQPDRPIEAYDFQLVQLALRSVLPDAVFPRLSQMDLAGHEKRFAHAVNAMRQPLADAMRWNREHGILTFVFPFLTPMQNPVGRLMPRYDLRNAVYFIEKLNEALAHELEAYSNAYLFDLNEILSFYGKVYWQDDAIVAFNHGGFFSNWDFEHDQNRLEVAGKATDYYLSQSGAIFRASWQELLAMCRSIRQIDMVKLVVLDLDDTLWRGVIADLDADNLPTSEGWPQGLWETLSFLKRRGVLLAIISKNEEARVLEVWNQIFGRRLKLNDFAIHRINWRPKTENMAEILSYVNLLPRNVVYIDDNPVERTALKAMYPDLRVLGGTPLTWRRILLWSAETQVPNISTESAARTEMVQAQVTREEQRKSLSREEFLTSLNVRMNFFRVNDVGHRRFPRVLELINKTNQFNTTGRRWTQEECHAAFRLGTAFYAFEVADLYTDYGLVGVLVVDAAGIAQFVMSCRIMGLEAETAAVAQIAAIFRQRGIDTIFGAIVETDRNLPCRDVFSRCGLKAVEGGWRCATEDVRSVPTHITMVVAEDSARGELQVAE